MNQFIELLFFDRILSLLIISFVEMFLICIKVVMDWYILLGWNSYRHLGRREINLCSLNIGIIDLWVIALFGRLLVQLPGSL